MNIFEKLKIRKVTILLLGVFIALLSLQACQQGSDMDIDSSEEAQDLELIDNANLSEGFADQEVTLSDLAEFEAISNSQRTTSWFTSNWDPDNRILTIDFGQGCTGPFGKERSGKIVVTYADEQGLFISDRKITFENYVVNNIEVSGEIEIERAVRNENSNLQNTYSLNAYTLTYPDGHSFQASGSRIREWIAGEGDGTQSSNQFKITGSLMGESTRGAMWSHTILEPVIVDFSCIGSGSMLRTSGVKEVKFSLNNRERSRIVDFGNGECDGEYTVTFNDRVVKVEG